MNFIDYCIATKNYSTLKAIKDYTEVKTFTDKKKITKGALAAAALVGASIGGKKALDKFYVPKDKYDEVLAKGEAMTNRAHDIANSPTEAAAYRSYEKAVKGEQPTEDEVKAVIDSTSDEKEQEELADAMAEQHGFSRLYSDVLNMYRKRR